MMSDHKYFTIQGEVIWRGAPEWMKDKFFSSTYITIKCTSRETQKDGNYKFIDDYFTIQCFKESEILRIREGYIVKCKIKRKGNIWIKDNVIQTKEEFRKFNGEQIYYGRKVLVFESYTLIGSFEIVNEENNIEEIKQHNNEFKNQIGEDDDLPF